MGEQRRSAVDGDPNVAAIEEFIAEQLRLSKRLYRLTGKLHIFAPRTIDGEIEYDVEESKWRGLHSLGIIKSRNGILHMALNDELHLPEPFPISPFKATPSRFGFTYQNSRGNYLFTNYHSEYAAKHALDIVLQGKEYKWISRRLIRTDDDITIKGEHEDDLEKIIEYKFKGNEAKWVMPEPYLTYYRKLNGDALLTPVLVEREEPRERAPRVVVKSEPRPDGMTSLGEIAEELGIDPREARQILRKSVEKPAWGWAWPANAIDKIKAVLKKK